MRVGSGCGLEVSSTEITKEEEAKAGVLYRGPDGFIPRTME